MEVQAAVLHPVQVILSIALLMAVCAALGWQFCEMYITAKKEADRDGRQ